MRYLLLNLTFRNTPSTKGIVRQLLLGTFSVFKGHSGALLTPGHLYCVFPGESQLPRATPTSQAAMFRFFFCFVLRFFFLFCFICGPSQPPEL